MPAYLVQLRFPGDQRWVTVAVAETRASAATYAGAAFANATNDDGVRATQVRIVSEEAPAAGPPAKRRRPLRRTKRG